MVPAPFIVVVDANVLFPRTLRDTILRAAAANFYQLRWSKDILDEMERNLASTKTMAADKAARPNGEVLPRSYACRPAITSDSTLRGQPMEELEGAIGVPMIG